MSLKTSSQYVNEQVSFTEVSALVANIMIGPLYPVG